jgi:hypothetical protein
MTQSHDLETTDEMERPRDRRRANLRPPWKPGESGNPGGRPRGRINVLALLSELLEDTDENGKSRGERIVDALVASAENGDLRSIREILDRVVGKQAAVIVDEEQDQGFGYIDHTVQFYLDDLSDEDADILRDVHHRCGRMVYRGKGYGELGPWDI